MIRFRSVGLIGIPFLFAASTSAASNAGPSFTLPPNPVIEAWVSEVSADSLRASVERLVAFGTRHTASDTTSADTGIGAARNWVFEQFSALENPTATAGFFDWTRTICESSIDARNVTFRVDGSGSTSRDFLALAHLDSRTIASCDLSPNAPGANDNASGVALLLELARILNDESFDASLLLMATSGEEQGLFGSTAHATAAVSSGQRLDGVLNNDVVGGIEGCEDPRCPGGAPDLVDSLTVRAFSFGPETSKSRQLTRSEKIQQMRYLPEHTVNLIDAGDRPGRGGDHRPYSDRGFAASRFTDAVEWAASGGAGHQHNPMDLVKFMNFPYLQRNTQLNLASLANFLLAPESPAIPSLIGVGEGTLDIRWPTVTGAVAGYRAAFRIEGELFFFDVRSAGLDIGLLQNESFSGLPLVEPYYVSVSAYDADGNESVFSRERRVQSVVDVADPGDASWSFKETSPLGAAASEFALNLPEAGLVRLTVYDVVGRQVRALLHERSFGAGETTVRWDRRDDAGRQLRAGVYLARLSVNGVNRGTLKTILVD